MKLGVFIALLPAMATAQTSPARPQFEVASLKPNPGCENNFRGGNLSPSPGRLEMTCTNLQSMLQAAYGTFGDGRTVNTRPLRIEGTPPWAQSEYYSLSAKSDGPARTEMLAGPMLQTLLEERFQLKAHPETRQMPVYALTVGKGGIKTPPLAPGGCTPIDLTHPPKPPEKGAPPPNLCGLAMFRTMNGVMTMEVKGVTLEQYAQRLSGQTDRPVIDKTGVVGMYTFHLEFSRDGGSPSASAAAVEPALPTIAAALQEQLGLKLVPEKGPVQYLVIDHVEKPTAN